MSGRIEDKKTMLKEVIKQLHAGASPQEVKERFRQVLEGVSPGEIAKIEQELIKEGMPSRGNPKVMRCAYDSFQRATRKAKTRCSLRTSNQHSHGRT